MGSTGTIANARSPNHHAIVNATTTTTSAATRPIAAAIRNVVNDGGAAAGDSEGVSTQLRRPRRPNMNPRHRSWPHTCEHEAMPRLLTRRLRVGCAAVAAVALAATACGDDQPPFRAVTTFVTGPPADESLWPTALDGELQHWSVRVIRVVPHDATAFTQGLEVSGDELLESTGRRGRSTVRRVDLETGVVLDSRPLDNALFGEGLTVAGDDVIQLTWTAGVALRYDATSLEPIGTHTYEGQGWGLCHDGSSLWMSDGSARLTRRDPETFEATGTTEVRREGTLVADLNELECVEDHVLANVWKSDEILVIDPISGRVDAVIDATSLVADVDAADDSAVLNGIADLRDGTLLIGGKLWPRHFIVELVAAAS